MRRILMEVEYHGQAFFGWQRQGSQRSVQATLEAAIKDLVGHDVNVQSSGRTDRGVHAFAMPAHVDVDTRLGVDELVPALNARMPEDLAIKTVRDVDPRFHARFDAISKLYRYTIYRSRTRSPLLRDRSYFCPRPLDLAAMEEAAAALVGTHDFASFRTNPDDPSAGDDDDDAPEVTPDKFGPAAHEPPPLWRKPRPKGCVRHMLKARLHESHELLHIDVEANGFLRGMVRAIAGSLLEVGLRKQAPDWIAEIIAGADRKLAGANLPAHGLALIRVNYPDEPFHKSS
ncbi:MAG: tRNA pseudouridine synthase A [Planctomycetes bacterium]|nr:tRNA pseudouridine synthase A [Planctomycetota bacterium]